MSDTFYIVADLCILPLQIGMIAIGLTLLITKCEKYLRRAK